MKTITEFDGFFLKRVIDKHTALSAESKTPEEIQAAIGEEFKAEGDKLKFLMIAVEFAKPKIQGLKRVLVSSFNEGEKVPSGFSEKEGQYFSLEHFPLPPKPARPMREGGRNDRGGKRDRKKDGKRGAKPRRDSRGAARGDAQDKNATLADGQAPRRDSRPKNKQPRPPKAQVERPPAKVKITFADGKPNIQAASSSPSPETQSPSQSLNQAPAAADSSQS